MLWWGKKKAAALVQDGEIDAHPLADAFPMIEGDMFEVLRQSIAYEGQLEEIVLFEGKVLDGRNRLRACRALGIEPKFKNFEGSIEDAMRFVFGLNVARRHLTPSQLAMAAAKLSTTAEVCVREAAKRLNVSRASVIRARAVLGSGDASLIEATVRGDLTVHEASLSARGRSAAMTPDARARKLIGDLRKVIDAGHAFDGATRAEFARLSRTLAGVATGRHSAA